MHFVLALVLAATALLETSAAAQTSRIAMEETMVRGSDPGIEIYVRNKHRSDMTSFRPERTVLFVHGATYPASSAFDVALDGISWMDYIASRGYDVYLLDLRGYGRSTRPKEMSENPDANPPLVNGMTAVKDISSVVEYILTRRNIANVNLIGWSWGATLMATYATQNPEKVQRLIEYGPPWVCATPTPPPGRIAAYRTLTRDQVLADWYAGVPEGKRATLMPPGWFDTWANATWASDPAGASLNPPVIRAPNGVLQDIYDFHCAGKPYFDAAKITVPTLLVVAEWDRDTPPYMARTSFPLLVNSPDKRLIELREGTHHIMLEKNRMELFEAVQTFLDDDKQQ
jgi:pimeloyl-ACP methyl ester carboxylesterase